MSTCHHSFPEYKICPCLKCQLSKLYAYNGLMLSGGTRIEGIDIDKPHRVIVVDNNEIDASAKVISVEDTTGKGSVRKYERVEKVEDFHVTEFDGEGIVSKKYAEIIDKAFCGTHCHTSFQIRTAIMLNQFWEPFHVHQHPT